jgi:hypothetical protein
MKKIATELAIVNYKIFDFVLMKFELKANSKTKL